MFIGQHITNFDVAFLRWIHFHHTPLLDTIFLLFSSLANPSFLIPVSIAIAGYLAYSRRHTQLRFFMIGVAGAAILNLALKGLIRRDRPDLWHTLIEETNYSFPSGHAMASSAFILCVIILLWNTRWRSAAVIIGSFLLLMIGLSRLYLGVHYPSDVIGGWAISAIWVSLVYILSPRQQPTQTTSK